MKKVLKNHQLHFFFIDGTEGKPEKEDIMEKVLKNRKVHFFFIDGTEEIYEVVPPNVEDSLSVKTQIYKMNKEQTDFLLIRQDEMIVIQRRALKKFVISPPFEAVPQPALQVVRYIK